MYIIKSVKTLQNITPDEYHKVRYIMIFQKDEIFLEEYFNKILNFVNLRLILIEVGGNALSLENYDFNKFVVLKKIYGINIIISEVKMCFNLIYKDHSMIINYLGYVCREYISLSFNEERVKDINMMINIINEKSIKHVKIFQNSAPALCYFCSFLPDSVESLQININDNYQLIKLNYLPSSLKELDIVMDFNSFVVVFDYEIDGDTETYDDDESGTCNNKKIIVGDEIYDDDDYTDELVIKNNIEQTNKKLSVIKSNIKLPFGCKLNFIDKIYLEFRQY